MLKKNLENQSHKTCVLTFTLQASQFFLLVLATIKHNCMFPYNAHLGLVESFSQPNLLCGMMYTDGNLHHALYGIFDSYSWDGHRENKICTT